MTLFVNLLPFCRLLYLSSQLEDKQDLWAKEFDEYSLVGAPPVVSPEKLIDHCLEYPTHTIKEQLDLLGSVSNYHWWVSLTIDRLKRSATTKVRMSQHVMVTSADESNFFPASPRNQLMFSKLKGYSDRFLHTAMYMTRFDRKEEEEVVFGVAGEEAQGGEGEGG